MELRRLNGPGLSLTVIVNPRRDAVLRSRNGSAPQLAATAPDATTKNRLSELKIG
ncbi:hypothetical protein [Rhizobium ruizarguesonis]|uniref:hypothetical protein n=1 Tax=Rhizobium ruizarguesonis TaxID=2081791 RepID=UPI0013EF0744|nr:hypothetical protein [Rhizobium ruizarguesonis]